jgi:hypothetical protein
MHRLAVGIPSSFEPRLNPCVTFAPRCIGAVKCSKIFILLENMK